MQLLTGEEEYILIHTEFESQKPNKEIFPKRMFKYYCQLFLRFEKPIIPIVIFSDDRKWNKFIPDTYSIKFEKKEYLKYFYHSIKLNQMSLWQLLFLSLKQLQCLPFLGRAHR